MMPTHRSHRLLRTLVLLLTGTALAACCFHDHCGGGYRYHCAPIRFCR